MKLCVLGPGEQSIGYTTKRLLEEGSKVFKHTDLVPILDVKLKIDKKIDAVIGKKSLSEYDYILPRIDSKRAEMGYLIMNFVDDMGVKKPYSASTILIAHNKFLTLEKLSMHGLKVPKTFLTGSKQSAKEILRKEKLPVILKLLSGFGGQGVMFMESKEAAESAIETMKSLKQQILLEEYIKTPGEDIRGIVAGDEIIASYKRVAAAGEKKANIHAGGRAALFKLTGDMEEVVLKCGKAISSTIYAVDMLQGNDGPEIIEVNINFGLGGIEKATNINVAQRIIEFVKGELKK